MNYFLFDFSWVWVFFPEATYCAMNSNGVICISSGASPPILLISSLGDLEIGEWVCKKGTRLDADDVIIAPSDWPREQFKNSLRERPSPPQKYTLDFQYESN